MALQNTFNNNSKTQVARVPMSKVLASTGIVELGKTLELTQEQLAKAKSTALKLFSDAKLINCDTYSIAKYCFETARYNFTRDDCIYPVPYNGKVQAQLGYKGVREMAMRSGKYNEIDASPVYDNDKVTRDRLTGKESVEFSIEPPSPDNKIIGYLAYAIDKQGKVTNTLYWSIDKIEKHARHYSQPYSKGFQTPWSDKEFGFEKMAKKTMIKQLCNELDQTPEYREAMKEDYRVFDSEDTATTEDENVLEPDVVVVDSTTGEVNEDTPVSEEDED